MTKPQYLELANAPRSRLAITMLSSWAAGQPPPVRLSAEARTGEGGSLRSAALRSERMRAER